MLHFNLNNLSNLMKNNVLLLIFSVFLTTISLKMNAQCIENPDKPGKFVNLDGTDCTNSVSTAVPFLRIVADARSGAMGDVGIGLSPDPNAMHFNASKLAFAEQKTAVSATYTPWLRSLGLNDVYLAYLTGYTKLDERQAIGASLRYFSLGEIPFTDQNGEALITGRPNEFEVAIAYARQLTDQLSAAVTGKFIYSNLAAGQIVSGETISAGIAGAADLSVTYKGEINMDNAKSDITVGIVAANIGSKITYTKSLTRDYIPANLGIGAAWNIDFDDYNRITFAGDINKLMVPTPCQGNNCDTDNNGIKDYREQSPIRALFSSFGDAPEGFSEELRELMYSVGMEYWYDKQFAVRAGYFNENRRKGNRKYFTVGLGLKYNIFGLNFSYLVPTTNQRNPLDNTLRFSLLFDFGALE